MTPKEIAQLLARDCESVCKLLLPNGKREGAEWRVGSLDGDAGKSLGVHLTGTKAGVWCDFAQGRGGDLIDLWAQTKGISIAEALKETRAYLGVADPRFVGSQPKTYRKPESITHVAPAGKVLAYLAERGITPAALKAYKVRASTDDTEIVFPYLRGELVNVKHLKLERTNGKKQIRLERDCEPCLFGWQAIPTDARAVTLCEGELDALTLWQYGFPAMSVFSGAGNHTWIENEFSNLERFDEIFLCFDRDEAGERGVKELAARLGRERCRIVRLPYKDANECLQRGLPQDAMHELFAQAETCDPAELKSAASYADDVIREFYPPEGEWTGFRSPWNSIAGKLKFRPTEVIVLNGINGHGKSQFLGNVLLSAMEQGEKCCVASLEMKPKKWLKRMVIQSTTLREPAIPYIHQVHDWFDGKLWVYDLVGSAKTERLLEVFRYARKRYGITVFAIDSLLKCGIGDDDYNGQKLFVEKLCDFVNEYEVTLFLVTHSRKGESEAHQSDKMDVKGSGSITDLTSTILNIWRNKAKEENPDKHADSPDAIMFCHKQRNGDWEGRKWLWYHMQSMQFVDNSGVVPHRFVHHMRDASEAVS